MSATLSLVNILAALAPQLNLAGVPEVCVRGICIDSRQARENDLFVAFNGEQRDGHDFVTQAFAKGACLALTERPLAGVPFIDCRSMSYSSELQPPLCLVVPNTLAALQQLAAAHRQMHSSVVVVGVTGSMGKTTAKEAIASVLSQAACTLKSAGNRNNEIGLPLTLLELCPEHRFVVLEMGMYALGEIALLCRLAQPQVGVVLNVGSIHLERMGTIERIAQAKAELVQALPADGLVILNGDDERVASMSQLTQARVITFGLQPGHSVWADQITAHGLKGISMRVHLAPGVFPAVLPEYDLRLQLLGRHAAYTALAAVAVGLSQGLGWEALQAGLDALGYGLRLVPEPGMNGATLLNDCYNANPSSMMAALDVLFGVPGRHIAILGDMLELGTEEIAGHRAVGRHTANAVDLLLTVGHRAHEIAAGAKTNGMTADAVFEFQSNAEVIAFITSRMKAEDVILIKGSRGMAMDSIVQALTERPI